MGNLFAGLLECFEEAKAGTPRDSGFHRLECTQNPQKETGLTDFNLDVRRSEDYPSGSAPNQLVLKSR
jgi:hypothetical protein